MTLRRVGVYCSTETVLKMALYEDRQPFKSDIIQRGKWKYANRWLLVTFAGDDFTSDRKLRVLTSFVTCGMARKSSNIPGGGVGAS